MTNTETREEQVRDLRVAAKEAMRDAVMAENLSCYFDGDKETRKKATVAYDAALKAIDALAEAVNAG